MIRRYPDKVPATELAEALALKPNTLSTYVSALTDAGLLTRERNGTSLLYRVDIDAVRKTFEYLLLDCCRGRPDVCVPSLVSFERENAAMEGRKFNVLFICSGNSARSIFAEAILRSEAGDRFNAYSAGTRPNSQINPFALDVLRHKGHDTSLLTSKHVKVFQAEDAPSFDFVITVCNRAANEECPSWDGQPVSAHWGMPDPVKVDGTDAAKSLAFQQSYGALRNRIVAFTSLPFGTLDRLSLQRAVDDICEMDAADAGMAVSEV